MQIDRKEIFIIGTSIVVLVTVLIIFIMKGKYDGKETTGPVTSVAPSTVITPPPVEQKEDPKAMIRQEIAKRLERFPKERHNSLRLSALMDEEEMHDEARELARKMALEGTPEEKGDALTAFEWLGGKDAVDIAIGMLKTGDEYLDQRASDVLTHLIQENLMKDEELMTTGMWQSLFNQLQDETEIESFMVLLGGYPNQTSVPVLLELAKSERQEIVGKALEHLGSIAYGEEFSTREAAEEWFKNYFANEARNTTPQAEE
jgi:hypothetical protein